VWQVAEAGARRLLRFLLLWERQVPARAACQRVLRVTVLRLGAADGSVSDIFLPRWFSDRMFPIFGTSYLIGCVLIAVRIAGR
jgi:hypothetical protein